MSDTKNNPISAYMAMIGKRGGKSRSPRKMAALAASRAVRLAGLAERKNQTKKGKVE